MFKIKRTNSLPLTGGYQLPQRVNKIQWDKKSGGFHESL